MWLYVLALAFVCEAHVRLLHKPYFTLPIRNAPSASADGTLSTAGPCGGIPNWGNRSYYSNVTVGQNLSLVFAYNGGHQSATQNMLRVAMICGKPQSDKALATTTVAPTFSPLVNASASLTSGYDVWVVIPAIQAGTDGDLCTISVLDVRNWGGCVDVRVLPAPSSPTPAPAAQNALAGKSVAGVYNFAQAQCTVDSPGCCCLTGKLTVVHVAGAATATGTALLNSCGGGNSTAATQTLSLNIAVSLAQQATTLASLRATVTTTTDSTLTFQVAAGTTNTLIVTDDSDKPKYCGFEANLGSTGTTPTPAGGGDSSSAPAIGGGVIGLMLAVAFSQ